jgi:hypothetical protein
MVVEYAVVVCEHDSTPWREDHRYTRQGAWKRVHALARLVVANWPHPVFVSVYRVRKDEKHLVWSEDLRNIQP